MEMVIRYSHAIHNLGMCLWSKIRIILQYIDKLFEIKSTILLISSTTCWHRNRECVQSKPILNYYEWQKGLHFKYIWIYINVSEFSFLCNWIVLWRLCILVILFYFPIPYALKTNGGHPFMLNIKHIGFLRQHAHHFRR